mgnify:FL=1
MALTVTPAELTATALTLTTAAQPNITSVGTLTTLTVDDITINGSTISDGGDLTLDVANDIILDADSGVWRFKDAGTTIFQVARDGNSYLGLYSGISDMDMRFQGNDGGSTVTALTLDMSEAGAATFNSAVTMPSGILTVGDIKAVGTGGLSLQTDEGTKRLFINDDGKVGISAGGVIYASRFSVGKPPTHTPGSAFTTSPSSFFSEATLGGTTGNSQKIVTFAGEDATNVSGLSLYRYRRATGTNWTTDGFSLRQEVDGTANIYDYINFAGGKVGIGLTNPARRKLEISDTTPGIVFHDTNVTNLTHEIVGGGNAGLELSADYQNVGTGYIRFDVGGIERARITEAGHIKMAAGGGIDFSATANAGFGNTSGTVNSEVLDDYEEGSWNPQIIADTTNPNGSTLSSEGHYVRIGRQVFVSFYVGVSWSNSPSGGIYVQGLPFNIANSTDNTAHIPCVTYNFAIGNQEVPFLATQTNNQTLRLYMMSNGAWGAANFNAHVSNPLYISAQVTYFAA